MLVLTHEKLGRAYETLKDESERRKYDLIYPSIKGKPASSQHTQGPSSHSVPKPHSAPAGEAAQIVALEKSKQERAARWRTTNMTIESEIFEIKRHIRRFEQEIKGLDSITAAEAAAEAQKNSWTTWFLSPIYKKVEDSDEVKEQKDRARQERRIERDMKERRLNVKIADLKSTEERLDTQKTIFEVANMKDEEMIAQLRTKIWQREYRERREKEEAERIRRAHEMKQQREQWEKREREAAEARRQQQAAERAAQQKRHEEETLRRQKIIDEELRRQREAYATFESAYRTVPQTQTRTTACRHDGWWPKVQGRTECPKCLESWTYLL
jgi:curved DNA-binding protein CbpA